MVTTWRQVVTEGQICYQWCRRQPKYRPAVTLCRPSTQQPTYPTSQPATANHQADPPPTRGFVRRQRRQNQDGVFGVKKVMR
ncbi:hypothetical protein E2C01_088664 [Portunus trituberculatus]|uniref:Uncharacterized protein n=1 Tax=Portunus trituberculatus TaxID=210409 RepID=A0A5B7J6S3_PORTR|nr:hypothetical protein [Portunus trituberculatus]